MKKFLLALTITLLLFGCSHKQYSLNNITECKFPDNSSQDAPLWVCNAPVEGLSISGIGIAEKSVAGVQFAKDQASAQARAMLARQLKTSVKSEVKNYVESNKNASAENATQVSSTIVDQITDQTLVGSRTYRYITSEPGTMYVLVGLTKANLISTLKLANDKAGTKLSDADIQSIADAIDSSKM